MHPCTAQFVTRLTSYFLTPILNSGFLKQKWRKFIAWSSAGFVWGRGLLYIQFQRQQDQGCEHQPCPPKDDHCHHQAALPGLQGGLGAREEHDLLLQNHKNRKIFTNLDTLTESDAV